MLGFQRTRDSPILGMFLGHVYPHAPMLGIAPGQPRSSPSRAAPLDRSSHARYLVIIPLLWSVIGFGAAMNFGVREDIGLLISGVLGAALILYRERRARKEVHAAASATAIAPDLLYAAKRA